MTEMKTWNIYEHVTENDELKNLLPDLSEEEKQSLRESIEENGFDSRYGRKIILWDCPAETDEEESNESHQYFIIDGHNRWEICRNLLEETGETKYKLDDDCFTFMEFPGIDEAKMWIISNQLVRRNLSVYGKFEALYRNVDILRAQGRKNMSEGGKKGLTSLTNDKGLVCHKFNTRKELADRCGVSEGTVRKYMAIADSEYEDLKEDLRYSRKTANGAYKILKSRLGSDSEEDGKEVSESKEGDDHSRSGKRDKSSDSQDLMILMEEYKQKNKDLYQENQTLKTQLADKEAEIQSLKEQLAEAWKLAEEYSIENEELKRRMKVADIEETDDAEDLVVLEEAMNTSTQMGIPA